MLIRLLLVLAAALAIGAVAAPSSFAVPPCWPDCEPPPPPPPPPPPRATLTATLVPRFDFANPMPYDQVDVGKAATIGRVSLDACGSGSGTYVWSGPVAVGNVCRAVVDVDFSAAQTHRFSLSAARTQAFSVTVTNVSGSSTATASVSFARDYLIASLGDSAASGEGNPDVAAVWNWYWNDITRQWERRLGTPGQWTGDRRCHRSSRHAAPALAAKRFQTDHPMTTVTFLHLACSGAGIAPHDPTLLPLPYPVDGLGGLISDYAGLDHEKRTWHTPMPAQIDELARKTGVDRAAGKPGRKIDALVISIGINDIGFGPLIWECASNIHEDCDRGFIDYKLSNFLNTRRTDALYGKLLRLKEAIDTKLNVDPADVYITEYPDGTRNDFGLWSRWPGLLGVVGVNEKEAEWMSRSVLAWLNSRLRESAAEFGWTYVGDVASKFRYHGIAAGNNRWIRTYEDSVERQGDVTGSVHPTEAGHEAIADAIGATLHTGFTGLAISPASYLVLAPGESVTLTAVPRGDGPFVYRWSTKQTSPSITVIAGPEGTTSTYTVEVTDPVLGKTLTRTVSVISAVEVEPPPECFPIKICG